MLMKKFLLSLLVMVASVALAQEVTFDFKSNPWGCTLGSGSGPTAEAGNIPEITQDGVVLTFDIGTHQNTPPRMWTGPQLRVYKGNTVTLTVPAGKTVVKAVWTATEKKYHGLAVGGVDVDATAGWSGSATELVFDVTTNSRYNSLVVTLAAEGEEPGTGGGEEPGTGGGEEPGEGEEPGTGGESGDLSAFNGDFETWVNGLPNNWKTASTAGNATLSQSTDAHSGNYSVRVGGTTSGNKRLGYKEMTLKAGTYTMKFYAKAATETGASVRPGYTPVDADNKAGSYAYGDYTNDITNSEWVEVTHEFTLEADTRLALVIMNAKNPGADVLIDDFTFETTNGGILDGGATDNPEQGEGGEEPGDTPEPEVPTTSALWTSPFTENQGDFTVDNKVLPAGMTTVWAWASANYGMKASAYLNNTTLASESWLVSPVLNLANATECSLYFEQAANKFNSQENYLVACKVVVKEENATEWTTLACDGTPSGTSWTFVPTTADLKAYDGKNIQVAFVYTSTDAVAGTWEILNFAIKGKGSVEAVVPEIPTPVYTTIAELKSNATDAEAAVKYTFTELLVTGVANANGSYSVYVTDGAEGLLLYGKNVPNCKAGDKISGTIESGLKLYNGLTEIVNADYTNVTVVSSDNAVTPLVLTMSEIGSDLKKYENMLVKLEGITFAANALDDNNNITMIDEADCEMTLRDNFGVLADFIFDPAKPYNVTAFVASYKGNPQLYPLSAEDVEVITNLLPSNVAWEKEEVAILSGEAWVVENAFSVEGDAFPVFTSSNEAVATVDESGVVTVKGYGFAEITAEVAETDKYLASKSTFKLYVIEGAGTLDNAYTVADVLYFYGKVTDKVWVKGEICGYLKDNQLFATTENAQASNLALGTADSYIPVQLSSKTAPRENLNLLDNPEMLGQTVWVYGNIEKYFSMPGLKSVTDFSLDGVTAIDAVEVEDSAKGIYLLDGRRVMTPVKGINIINGKKVMVK